MIRYIKNSGIDNKKWDNCIKKSVNGNPYALSWYLDIIHGEWEALVEGDYERVMPLTGKKKYGIWYLYQPYFAQQLGVFSTEKLNPETVKNFLRAIPPQYRYVDINLNSFNKIEGEEYEIIYNSNYMLDLIHDYEKISVAYSKNTKRNLKKSRLHRLSMMKGVKPEELIRLFRENRGRTLKKWGEIQYRHLGRLMYSSIYKGKGVIYGVYDERNQLCAGAFFVKSNNRLIFLFSGTSEKGREVAAMTYLIDGVIEEFTPSRLVLDFEGSNNPDLARFYKGFGAKETHYPRLRINKLRFPARQVHFVYDLLKKK
ncbi:MAG: hypothetical protein GXO86_07860 [Chlorobi bacterium]|nr:hypothetical protein [Chlorobiota bacterium]